MKYDKSNIDSKIQRPEKPKSEPSPKAISPPAKPEPQVQPKRTTLDK